ncbi:phytanoyl-CoA hydroxylase [Talaromyces islandicus]|uniref:Phytanoyl-CoA hydroxylase n=1 Tax=Talaromyces islandicus TaxID=28573 RepID=A0A0U1MAG4_TALIS|nr:phytanoyl-CoA hydroxylase [Talaromyces islandicus]
MPGVELETNLNLAVSDGPLTANDVLQLQPSYSDEQLDVLRARYEKDGMLLLKGLIPREDVLQARANYFEMMSPTGVLKEDTTPVQGIFNPNNSPDDFPGIGAGAVGMNGRPGGDSAQAFVDLAIQAHYEDWYTQDLCKHSALLGFVAKFTGWKENTLGLKRSLLRNNVPHTKPIGVHYDQIFLRHGEPTSVTAWVPMGDVSLTGGGLIYLEDGDTVGQELEANFNKKARECGLSEDEARNAFNQNMMSTGLLSENPAEFAKQYNRRWLVSAYDAGDVVLHKPHAIHASTVNHDPDNVIRLATDLRFVNEAKPYDTRWTKYYEFGDGV